MAIAAIETVGLTKTYAGVDAISELDIEVHPGEIVGFLGPNGAGKTTTIRLLLGLIRPTRGTSSIFGFDSQRETVAGHRRLSYVPGESSLWPGLTGEETLHLLGRLHGSVDETYRDQLIQRFAFEPAKKVRTYSKGNRQKLVLIAALMVRPDLLVLDEPTAGLDPLMEQEFRRSVLEAKERSQSVFLSSHMLSEVEALCDRVGILNAGRLVEMGTLSEMRHLSSLTIQATFEGTVPDVSRVPGVTSVVVEGHLLQCQVHGLVEPLLKVLANASVHELLSREPTLEELFLAHYGADSARPTEAESTTTGPG